MPDRLQFYDRLRPRRAKMCIRSVINGADQKQVGQNLHTPLVHFSLEMDSTYSIGQFLQEGAVGALSLVIIAVECHRTTGSDICVTFQSIAYKYS